LEEAIQIAYDENRRVYGQRKIKCLLLRRGLIVSRRKIGRIMKRRGLVSAYTRKKYRVHASKVNEAPVANLLDRKFGHRLPGACVVSDLTYVRVGAQWAYICILLDLGAREIIGYSAGAHKTAELVHSAFASVKGNLFEIQIFHTDRGSEFDNILIDEFLESFQIRRSLSMKGCPYDNAVAESTFKMIKAEGYDELDRYLDSRQYGIIDPTHVMTMDLGTVAGSANGKVVTTRHFYKEWVDSFIRCNSIPGKFVETAKAMLSLITVDVIVASVVDDSTIVACGYGALEAGCVGFYDIVVDPEYRKRGYGRALMEAIIAQARLQGAQRGYLQVRDSNEIARRLYLGLGFREEYAYWYRVKNR